MIIELGKVSAETKGQTKIDTETSGLPNQFEV
jgi:hypothetical protein